MATFYIPDSTGWKSSLASGSGYGYLRIRVDQTYDAATNKSSLKASIEIKSGAYGSGSGYHMQDGGSFVFPKSSSSAATVDHNYTLATLSTTEWNTLRASGSAKYWTVSVTHNADGTVTVYGAVSGFRLQNPSSSSTKRIWTWDKSGSITLSNTPSYKLTLSAGAHSGCTVKRNGVALSNGATIYRGDKLVFDYSPDTGYNIGTHTVNGSVASNGYSWTVTGAASVVTTAYVKYWTMTATPDAGAYIIVRRTSSPLQGASTGVISSGATVYYGDVLDIEAGAQSGYVFGSCTVNGEALVNPYTVTGAVVIVATTTQAGAWLFVGGVFGSYQIMIFNGATWDTYIPYVYTGAGWEVY